MEQKKTAEIDPYSKINKQTGIRSHTTSELVRGTHKEEEGMD